MGEWEQLRIADIGFEFELTVGKRILSSAITTVTLNGERFDLEDLYEALSGIKQGDTYIWESRMCKHLLKLEVLKSCGSRRAGGAFRGHRFEDLFKQIEELHDAAIEE